MSAGRGGHHGIAIDDAPGVDRYDAAALAAWLASAFAGCGVAAADAALAARVLVRTNSRGVDTHGVSRTLVYLRKLRAGEVTARPAVEFAERGGVLHCHADGGLGQAVASDAFARAIARAADTAFVPLLLHEVGHLGALGMFALQAAEAGMLAFVAQSTSPVMALPGARGAAIGNNPIAFATPVAGRAPLVFDVAASGVARGNVLAAARDSRPIPAGWAIDAEGNPTTDAAAALAGAMLPMAGHKGIGLAMMVQTLAGSLTGARPAAVTGSQPGSAAGRVGAFAFVANPALVAGRAEYDAHLADWLEHYLSVAGPGGRYPGERAAALESLRTATGIPLPASVVAELRQAGELSGAAFTLEPISPRAPA